jgi:hypothetical protein
VDASMAALDSLHGSVPDTPDGGGSQSPADTGPVGVPIEEAAEHLQALAAAVEDVQKQAQKSGRDKAGQQAVKAAKLRLEAARQQMVLEEHARLQDAKAAKKKTLKMEKLSREQLRKADKKRWDKTRSRERKAALAASAPRPSEVCTVS